MALGYPKIGREVRVLPKRFTEYLESIQMPPADATNIDNARQYEGGESMEIMNKNLEILALQQAQNQIIISKLALIEQRIEALELLTKTRNVDFDEQFEKIRGALVAIAQPQAAVEPAQAATPIQVPTAHQDAPQARQTPAQARREAPPEPTDHRGESLPDWIIQDLSYDFEIDAIKNRFEMFKQYYREKKRIMPDDNGIKIQLRQWLERAAKNGEQVMSRRALIEIEKQRQQAIRAENTRRHEEHERYRREVQSDSVFAVAQAGLDNILAGLGDGSK